jgi:hypothetical protein
MKTDFPYVQVTMPEQKKLAGKPDIGTRIYRREGTYEESGQWAVALDEVFNEQFVSPGGVGMFVPSSRASVYKRLKEGRLTAFCFHVVKDEKTFFGKVRKAKSTPYVYIPVSECQAWAKELAEKRDPEDAVTSGDARRDLLEKDPADRGNKNVVYGEKLTAEEIVDLVQSETRTAVEKILAKVLPGKMGEKHRKRLDGYLVKDGKTGKWKWKDSMFEK